MGKETVDVLVKGGQATPAPPIGPALSQLKVNAAQVVKDINDRTASFKGMEVPVKIIVDTETKKWEIKIGTPPVSALIRKEMKVEKLAFIKDGNKTLPGSIKLESVVAIAKSKESIPGDLRNRVMQVLGTCLSGGVLVDGRDPREVQKDIKAGKIEIK